jgi:sigma-B regulation protein RsbU (phosphoserine phosphatase)
MFSLFHSRAPEPPPTAKLVPTVFPKIEGAEIAAVFLRQRVAGDFYDSIRVSPERVLFGLLDVAGRREENRELLTHAQDMFRAIGSELFSRPDINESDAMTELCLRLNRGLIESSTGVHPCPAFIACYHEKFGTLCYTNAGHTAGLLRDSIGVSELASTGLPLGLFSHATCDAPTVGLEKDSALVLVSRGVVECSGNNHDSGEEFGVARVKELLQNAPQTSAQELCSSILNATGQFSPQIPPRDDRTALALVRTA